MSREYKLNYTASEINEKLSKVDAPVSWYELKDRPFGETIEVVDDILCDKVIDGGEFYESYIPGVYETNINIGFFPQPGKTYKVIFDDVEYDCVAYIVNDSRDILLGNPAMCRYNEIGVEDPSKPFALLVGGNYGTYVYDNNSHSVKVIAMENKVVTTIVTLDAKYAPDYLQVGKSISILPVTKMYDIGASDGIKAIRLMPPAGMNINYEYTFKIRNDIYENVKPFTKEGYYDDRIWGAYDGYSSSNDTVYPFYLKAQETYGGGSIWDADGFFRGYGSSEPRYNNPLVDFGWVTEVYPDLDVETEVEIYAVIKKTFDGEYLPDYLQFGVPKDVDKCVFKDTIHVTWGSGSSYNGLHALRADKVYTVIINDKMYKLTSWVFDGWGTPYICLGNGANLSSSAEGMGDSSVDFCIYGEINNSQYYCLHSETSDDYEVEIIGPVPTTGTIDPKYLPSSVVTGTIQWPEEGVVEYAPIINIDKTAAEITGMLKAGTLLFFRDHNEDSDNYYPILYSLFQSETEFECGFRVINTQNGLDSYDVWLWTDGGSVEGEVGYRNIADNILPDMDNIMLTSPNGNQFKLTVSDDGTLSAKEMTVG